MSLGAPNAPSITYVHTKGKYSKPESATLSGFAVSTTPRHQPPRRDHHTTTPPRRSQSNQRGTMPSGRLIQGTFGARNPETTSCNMSTPFDNANPLDE